MTEKETIFATGIFAGCLAAWPIGAQIATFVKFGNLIPDYSQPLSWVGTAMFALGLLLMWSASNDLKKSA